MAVEFRKRSVKLLEIYTNEKDAGNCELGLQLQTFQVCISAISIIPTFGGAERRKIRRRSGR
jgi:hypothetical protein